MIHIPDEAKKAATLALQKAWIDCASAEDAASAALAAGLAAWTTPTHKPIKGCAMDEIGNFYPAFILPLKKDKP